MNRTRRRTSAVRRTLAGAVALAALAACASTDAASPASTTIAASTTALPSTTALSSTTSSASTTSASTSSASTTSLALPPTTLPPTTLPPTTLPPTTLPPTTLPPTTLPPTTLPPTTLPPLPLPLPPLPEPDGAAPRTDAGVDEFPFLAATVASLVRDNQAISVSAWRDGEQIYGAAAGRTNAGGLVGTDTPFVLASVSKMVTAISVARLVEQDRIELTGPVPWTAMGIAHDPAWDDVTVRELLAHTSGMPVARKSWLNDPGSCAIPLTAALSMPPRDHRGTWVYSNGNYCALGLLVEHVTGESLAAAADELVFAPLDVAGAHLTTDGPLAADAPYTNGVAGVARLERLGGAGTWVASSNAVAHMMGAVTTDDRVTLAFPGIMQDQYGWGHTGSVDGAEACAWVMGGGHLVVVGLVAGNEPGSGGKLCDALVPALAIDLGIYAGAPFRGPA